MSDLKDGDYVFKVAAGSQPLAGIDIDGGFPAPIITNGHENVVSPLIFVQLVSSVQLSGFTLFCFLTQWHDVLIGASLSYSGPSRGNQKETIRLSRRSALVLLCTPLTKEKTLLELKGKP